MLLCLFYRQGNFSLEEAFAQGQIKSPSSKAGSKKVLLQPHRLCELEKKKFFFQGTASPTNICLGKIQERKHGREMDWMCSGPDSNTYQTRNFQTRELQHPQRKGGSVQLPTDLVLRRYGSRREGKSVEKAEAPPSHTLHILHQEAASATRVTSKCADRL